MLNEPKTTELTGGKVKLPGSQEKTDEELSQNAISSGFERGGGQEQVDSSNLPLSLFFPLPRFQKKRGFCRGRMEESDGLLPLLSSTLPVCGEGL